jgi:hypothetical protein
LWSEEVSDEEEGAAPHAATSSSAPAQEDEASWLDFAAIKVEEQPPSPTYLPPPPIYEDVRKGPHVYAEHDLNEEAPPTTDDFPDDAEAEAEAEEEAPPTTDDIPEPRVLSSFDKPAPLADGRERPQVYCVACYRLARQTHWNLCPHCSCVDSTVPEEDPLVGRCRGARMLGDNTIV